MGKGRLEAFSDGVIAIAITLLVLNISVPAPDAPGSLAHKLAEQWPSYAAYVVSFLTIGIIWINHHAALRRLREVDHSVLMLNLLLLLTVGLLPFSTALIAEYLKASGGEHLAAAVYSGSLLLMSIAFVVMHRHLLLRRGHLVHEHIGEDERRQILRRNSVGLLPYIVATAVAPLSAYLTLAICGVVAVYYALPQATADPQKADVG